MKAHRRFLEGIPKQSDVANERRAKISSAIGLNPERTRLLARNPIASSFLRAGKSRYFLELHLATARNNDSVP